MNEKDPKLMAQIISFVNHFFDTYHCTPTVRDIVGHVPLEKSAIYNYLRKMSESGVIDYDGRMIMTDYIQRFFTDYTQAGILGSVSCGLPEIEEENVEEYVNLPTSIFGQGKLYILRADGDSMKGAGIDKGDLLVVRKAEHASHRQIVIAYIEGEGNVCKRFLDDPENQRIILHAENDKYADKILKTCKIQGIVVSTIKQQEFRKIGERWIPEQERPLTTEPRQDEISDDVPF